MKWLAACFGALLLAGQALAQDDPDAAARAALVQLEEAARSLDKAKGARDRVAALTETIRAMETGLGAMRAGVRRVAARQADLTRQLNRQETEMAELLGVLQRIGAAPAPVLMAHPGGPLDSIRSGMILADIAPALDVRAARLRDDLEEVAALRLLQDRALTGVQDGLGAVQAARTELSQAIADRTGLPRRFTEDPVRTAILISSTETLDAFASGLGKIAEGEIVPTTADISAQKGQLPLPVDGSMPREKGNGIVVDTAPRALVISPVAATIRFRGALLDLGNVVILEPQADTLFVLSGLETAFGQAGEVIPAGTAVGWMGGSDPEIGAIVSLSGDGTGTTPSETLYIEVRENGRPVDPRTWFRTDKDG